MSRDEVEASVKLEAPRALKNIGATAIYKHALYIAEYYEGIHVIDNSNPTAPVKTGFIRVPGLWHLAVVDGSLVSDNSSDLVCFDISNPLTPALKSRSRGVLYDPPSRYSPIRSSRRPDTLVVGYKDTVVQVKGGMM
jgi:hypothetical protein